MLQDPTDLMNIVNYCNNLGFSSVKINVIYYGTQGCMAVFPLQQQQDKITY